MSSAAARYAELRAETSAAFDQLGSFLADLCEGSEAHQDSSGHEGPNLDTNLGNFYETFTALKARHADQNLTVAVLALTKSGKSTLLNALIGASCLPANNVPETARITRISHTAGQAELVDNTLGQSRIIIGEQDIKAYLQYLNSEVRMRDHQLSDETYLDLKIPIAALKAYDHDESRAHDVAIRLLDTPGPNEAGEIALKAQVERLLDSVDAVIYLLDYTKLKTADEAEVLQRLKEINPQLMARLSQRLFFVVNKADMIETSEGLDAEATKQYVADLITHQMQDESFQLKADQVLLVSAQHALLSRLVLQGSSDRDIALRFGRLAFGSRARSFPPHEYRAAAEEMLADSGVAELEQTVLAFLYAHSGSLKLLALLDDIVRMLQQIKNVAAASNAALQHDVAFLQKETQNMQSKLERSLQGFETVQQEAQAVEGEIVDEVQQRMQRLKEKLFRDVTNVLEPSRQHPPGRWQEAWHRAARFLNRRPGHSQAHQQELQNKLYELHAAISSSIEAEVRDFWQDVEAATNERQHAMFQCINKHLESLSRQIETTVGEALSLRLEPVTIAMDPPAAQDFHESLQNLFVQGIRQRSVTRNRRTRQEYTVWEPRFQNGLCRTGQYFVGRPASRHVTEQYEQPVYELQPQHIKEYFITLVDGTIEASVMYVREYVHAYLSDMLEEAKGQIQTYGQSFSATMQAALTTRQQGEEARSAALQVTTARLVSTNSLLRDVAAVQQHAEQLCPGQQPLSDIMSDFSVDEPESSHAVHAEPGSNHADSSHADSSAVDASSEPGPAAETTQAYSFNREGRREHPVSTGWSAAEAAVLACPFLPPTYGWLEPLASTSADAAYGQQEPAEPEGLWVSPMPAGAEGFQHLPMPAGAEGFQHLPMPVGAEGFRHLPMPVGAEGFQHLPMPVGPEAFRYLPMPAGPEGLWQSPVPGEPQGLWQSPVPAEPQGLWQSPVPAEPQGLWQSPMPAEEKGSGASPVPAEGEGSGLSPVPAEPEGSQESPVLPAVAAKASDSLAESPLPGMMSELQQAMSASVSSAGSAHEPIEGIMLDEQTQLELAVFLSLQDNQLAPAQETAAALEAALPELADSDYTSEAESTHSESELEAALPELADSDCTSEAESTPSESELEAASADSESELEAASADSESTNAEYDEEAEPATMATAAHAVSAAIAAAARADAAANNAAALAESAASSAVAQAEAAATAAAAQAESAAAVAVAHATAAASTLTAQVEAAARSVDAALNHQAASVRGTVLSFADMVPATRLPNWWALRHRGQSPGNPPASSGQATAQAESEALSSHGSDSAQQEEAELAAAAEQVRSDTQVRSEAPDSADGVSRRHSVSSDDSSFDLTEAPAAVAPAVPINQFAALSLSDLDSVVPEGQDDDDSPFDVHSVDHEGVDGGSHISHADEAVTNVSLLVPVIPWDASDSDQDLHHNAAEDQGEVHVPYPQVHSSAFSSSSSGSESPVHYPQLHNPVMHHPDADDSLAARLPASLQIDFVDPPSPRTRMHMTALANGAFSCQSSVSDDETQHLAVHEAGDTPPAGESAPAEAAEEPVEAAASIHVHQEHEGIGRLAALSGHAEMSHDSDEWEMVSSDMDEEL